MSLQIWLPLNGNLNNQGLSNLQFQLVNSTNTTINDNGKIGKCYNNNSNTAGGIVSTSKISLGQQHSMFCWFKFSSLMSNSSLGGSLVSTHYHNGNYGTGITIRYVSSTTGYLSVNTGNGSSRTYNTYYGTTLLQADTWYHGGFTYDGTNIKIYVNGKLEKTQSYTNMSMPENYIGLFIWSLNSQTPLNNYKLDGYLNDVRIYDHCLSQKEIEEISKGLVLHYKLDNQFVDSTTIYDSSGYNNNGSINNITVLNDSSRYNNGVKFNGSNSYIKVNENKIFAQHAQAMTINLWVKNTTWSNGANMKFFSCTESGGFNCEAGDSGYVRFPIYVCTNAAQTSYSYKFDSKEIQASALTANKWNMITWVYDTNGTKTYINGQLHHTYLNTSYGIHFNTNARLFLGCEAATANPSTPYYNGQMSDFRMYYTVLSSEAILELYNTSVTIDNNGNIYSRELVEI